MVIDQKLNDKEIISVLNETDNLLDQISIVQHHDAVAGTASQYVTNHYQFKLQKGQDLSVHNTKEQIAKALNEYAGI